VFAAVEHPRMAEVGGIARLVAYPKSDRHAPEDEKPAAFAAVSNAVPSVVSPWTVATNAVTFACLASVN